MKTIIDTTKLPQDFNPFQQWDSVLEACNFCLEAEHTIEVLAAVVAANIQLGEPGFCRELIDWTFRQLSSRPTSKDFKVVTVSTNTNAFGLKSIILVAQDGEAWQILKSPYGGDTIPKYGDVIKRVNDQFQCGTYEVPSRLSDCPAKAAKEIWG